MAIRLTQTDGAGPLVIAGTIDIYDATLLRDTLQQFIQKNSEALLDLSDIESCDASTAQLIVAARKSAQKLGRRFSIVAISEPVRETLAMLGLTVEQSGAN